MEVFNQLPGQINELVSSFTSTPIFGSLKVGLTQYTFWLIVSSCLLFILMTLYARKASLVPHGLFQNIMEFLIEFVENDVCKGILGDTWKRHFPFLGTMFLFILTTNLIGVIPGMKPGSGTISTTAALAIVVFIYFIGVGIKNRGAWGYIKSLAPKGVAFPLNVLVWMIEVISAILRPITLAVRLFCNMFAGHVVMGAFALMISLFADPMIQQFSVMNFVGSLPGLAFALMLLVIYAIEIFVAAVQAYVFTILSAVYIQSSESKSE